MIYGFYASRFNILEDSPHTNTSTRSRTVRGEHDPVVRLIVAAGTHVGNSDDAGKDLHPSLITHWQAKKIFLTCTTCALTHSLTHSLVVIFEEESFASGEQFFDGLVEDVAVRLGPNHVPKHIAHHFGRGICLALGYHSEWLGI